MRLHYFLLHKSISTTTFIFAEEYIDDSRKLGSLLRPGRLIIVDLRDEFIDKDDALGLFVIMLNIFAGVKEYQGIRFNKFIVLMKLINTWTTRS